MIDGDPPTKRKCLGVDCPNDAGTLQCPTCLKHGVKDSFFCSQDCFKKNWVRQPSSPARRAASNNGDLGGPAEHAQDGTQEGE